METSIRNRIKSLLRSPSIRLRKRRCGSQVSLERVVGITASGNSSLTCDPSSGTVAYPAGCVVVLLNPSRNRQQHIINSSRKMITALSFSSDGKYLVTGESGHLPAVRVWEVEGGTQVAELQEHKYGVSCVTFSPNNKYIVSVGSQHDMTVNLWVWKKHTLMATNKVSSKVTAVAFSDDSSYFVTAGNRHVRFWYLSHPNKLSATVPLMGRSGLLGELQNNFFCAVACGHGLKSNSTFCITSSGLLCEFNDRRVLEKWVHLQTSSAASLCVTEDLIFCACANGTVRVFDPTDLSFICTLPRPHHLGVDVASVRTSNLSFRNPNVQYPDSVAVTYDPVNCWLSCVYNNHSLYVWDTRDLQNVLKVYSALCHSAGVWDLQMFYKDADDSEVLVDSSGLFFSCSADGTVRLWSSDSISNMPGSNLLSEDLHEVIYMDDTSAALLDIEGTAVSSSEKAEGPSSESRNAIRSICVSPDGRHLASGDRTGTLRVHELSCMKQILNADVHESEIVCLEYSKPHTGMNLLVTASRDRLIHVLDVDDGYSVIQTLDEHSSSVTAVHFTVSDGELKLISCGADKSLYFHTVRRTVRGPEFLRTHHVVHKTTVYDMTVDPSGKYAAVCCQDRSVRVFNISSGKQKRSYKGSDRDDGHVLKIQMDPYGVYVASSCSDKSISLIDFRTGECLATVFGHSEIISSLMFTDDCRYLISASADSCIFVWRLAPELTIHMRERLSKHRHHQTVKCTSPFRSSSGVTLKTSLSITSCYSESKRDDDEEHPSGASVKGCEWNQSVVQGSCADGSLSEAAARPRRRWSCRMGSLELVVQSMLELRQLDSLCKAQSQNRSSAERLGLEQRASTSSLQERRVRPHSPWLTPASTPEPEGVVLYSEHWSSRRSVSEASHHLQCPADAASVCQSPSRGISVGYCSTESNPDQQHDSDEPEPLSSDDDDEACQRAGRFHTDIQQSFPSVEVLRNGHIMSDCSDTRTQNTPEGISTHFNVQKSSSRTGGLFDPISLKTTASDPARRALTHNTCSEQTNPTSREPQQCSSLQKNHPYLSQVVKHPSALQKSASVHNLTANTQKSLTPTRLRREVSRALSHQLCPCPQSWESTNVKRVSRARSYMSPTTSSRAKITRSVSIGDGLHLNSSYSCENLPSTSPSSPSTTVSGEPKHLLSKAVKTRACQRMSGPFAESPSRSSSMDFHNDSLVEDLGVDTSTDSEWVRTASNPIAMRNQQHHETFSDALQRERPRVAVKAFSRTSDTHVVQEASVSLEECRRAAAELRSSVQRTTRLYKTLMCGSGEDRVQQQQVLWDALLCVGSELDSVRGSGPVMMDEGKTALTLLERYSQLLLQSVEKRLQRNL